jgi:hypothetical protein
LGLLSCSGPKNNTDGLAKDTLASEEVDSTTYNEADLIPQDSLFKPLELELKEIKEKEFNQFKNAYATNCRIDSSGFISGYGLTVDTSCHEICLTDLVDSTGKMMQLPSDYDQGILGLIFSPSCNQFIIYSGYDAPDYDKYYQYRSEIIGFNIANGKGLEAIKPSFKYYTTDWSIEDITWVDDKTIALKVYEEGIPSNGNGFHHKYFKAELQK